MRKLFLFVALLASSLSVAGEFKILGQLASQRLQETSGIAVSRRDPTLLWGINDSGNPAELIAFRSDGSDLGFVQIDKARNIDWEDLASFELDDIPYILIADTGDNRGHRSVSWLYIVREPQPDAAGVFSGAVPLVTRLPIRFEDGPRDCEAVAVDVASDRVLLVSKSDFPPRLYELPLTLIKGIRRPLVARHVAVIPAMPRPTLAEFLESPLLGPWRHQPTALDVSRNGAVLGLMTFRNLYLFRRQPAQRWGEVVMATPLVLELPELSQTESVSFVGDRAITVAEGRSAQIISLGPLSAHLGRNVGPM